MKTFLRVILSIILVAGVCVATYLGMQKYQAMTQELKALQDTVNKQKSTIGELNTKSESLNGEKVELSKALDDAQKAIDELQVRKDEADKLMADYQKLQDSLKNLISAGTLTVKVVNGKMVVSMSTDILFPSGSAQLSKKGAATVAQLAEKLKLIPGKELQIEGHTDNMPIKTKQFPSNWELAAARAISVVTAMTKAGLPATRLSAASYAEQHPEFDNKSAVGRARNRRIEVAILPDLSSLPGVKELNQLAEASKKVDAVDPSVLNEAMGSGIQKSAPKKITSKAIPDSWKVQDQATTVKPQFRELNEKIEENELIEPIRKKVGDN